MVVAVVVLKKRRLVIAHLTAHLTAHVEMLKENAHASQEKCVLDVLMPLAVVVVALQLRNVVVLKKRRLVIAHLTAHVEMLMVSAHASQEKCVLDVSTLPVVVAVVVLFQRVVVDVVVVVIKHINSNDFLSKIKI